MNREENKEAFELFNKLDVIKEIEQDYALYLKGEPVEGELLKEFNAVLYTPNDCKLTVPYLRLEVAIKQYKAFVVRKLKSLGFGDTETDFQRLGGLADFGDSPQSADENIVRVPGAKYPLYWDKEYYVARRITDTDYVVCGVCGGNREITIDRADGKGKCKTRCPACGGQGKVQVHGDARFVAEAYKLHKVERLVDNAHVIVFLCARDHDAVQVRGAGLEGMHVCNRSGNLDPHTYGGLYETYEEAEAKAKTMQENWEKIKGDPRQQSEKG